MKDVFLYDTTLRDGAQNPMVSFSVYDKIQIVEKLDQMGMHYIEVGFAGSNSLDDKVFRQLSMRDFEHAKLAAFGMTRRPLSAVEEDRSIQALMKAGTPVVTIVGKAWDMHVVKVLRTTLEENLAMIEDSIAYLKQQGKEVIFDAEHFFDAFKNNKSYALETLKTAEKAGADWVVLCDTNGGILPQEVQSIVPEVIRNINTPVGIHCHDDSGVAVANSLLAVQAGVTQVQGTMNGLGERCGNANLTVIIPNLVLKMGHENLLPAGQLRHLRELSSFIWEVANLAENKAQPFVGQDAFTHKGGMHSDAILKESSSYEHIDPSLVGNERRIAVSDLAGKSAVLEKAREFGLQLDKDGKTLKKILAEIKSRQGEGFSYESADASLELLMKSTAHDLENPSRLMEKFFTLERFRVITETEKDTSKPRSEAAIKVKVNDREFLTAAEGNGPVNALDNALRKSLEYFYPELKEIELADYKVRITDQAGTGSKVRVLIETRDQEGQWTTVGASENILIASWQALADSVVYKLLKELEKKGFSLS